MSTADTALQVSWYVALDVHRNNVMVGAVDHQQQVVLTPRIYVSRMRLSWKPLQMPGYSIISSSQE